MKRFDARSTMTFLAIGWMAGCSGHIVLVADDAGITPTPPPPTPEAGPTPTPEAGPTPIPETGPTPIPEGGPIPMPEAGPPCTDLLPAEIRARWIAFDSDREKNFTRQIYKMQADGSNVVRVMTDDYADKEPFFHPDGASMTFTSDRAGVSQIFFLNGETGQVTQVTHRQEGADQSSISHDGAWVAYHSGPSIYVARLDGSSEQLVATGLDNFNAYFWPHFSLDDSELVFDRNNEINAAKINGNGIRQIVQNTTRTIKSPAVSPDGREVAYSVWCEAPGESVWTTPFGTNTESCKGRRVSPVGSSVSRRPAWGTSMYLAYETVDPSTNIGSIAVVSREVGSAACVITPRGTDNRNPSWSPVGLPK